MTIHRCTCRLLLLNLLICPVFADEPSTGTNGFPIPPDETAIEAVTEDSESSACIDATVTADNWLDRMYAYLNRELCEPAEWFDAFFGDPLSEERTPVGTRIRWRNQVRWDDREGMDYRSRLSGNVRLPNVSERVRLLISRDSDPAGGALDEDRPTAEQTDRTEVGLRFIIREEARSEFDVDAGVRGGLPPKLFTRARYRYTYPTADNKLWRLTETAFWRSDDEGFGLESRLDWEWLVDPLTLVRWNGNATISQDTDGVDWGSSVTAYHQLDERSALRFETGLFGRTDPAEVEEYYLNARYRSRFLRPWLFYELQPEAAWALDDDGKRGFVPRFIFTLEIYFENWPD